MRTVSALLVVALLAACKGAQQAQAPPAQPADARPEWVRARPVSSAYYIGIGLASKARPDWQEAARKNALEQLAQEISVRVEGNSLLFTADGRSRFDETFTSTIRTTTSEQLEGFELVDTYDSPTEHWVYYRLSKSEHARLKAERKGKAIATALDLHQRARSSIAAGNLREAIDQDLRALIAIKPYWGENDMAELDGRSVPLATEVYAHLQSLTTGIRLQLLPDRIDLDYGGRFRREVLVSAAFGDNSSARHLPQLPLRIAYTGLDGPVTEQKNTDAEGRLRTSVQRAANKPGNELLVRPDLDALVSKDLEPAVVRALMGSLSVPQARAPISVRMPLLAIRAAETNLGAPVGDAGLAPVIREELTRAGFRIVEREAEADLVMQVTGSTRSGGEANGFHTAFLDASWSVRDRRTGDVVKEGVMPNMKGIQLSMEKAGIDAYKRAGQEARKEIAAAILNALQ
ncbi:MAG: LPP20 family lipoprotein [Flavobacteriales bacterium]